MRVITLSQGKFAAINEADWEKVKGYKWYADRRNGNHWYARSHDSQQKIVYLHRLIMEPPDGMVVDHRNGNGLDCRRSNMRVCTHQENMRNRRKTCGLSQFKGVSRHKWTGRWCADVNVDDKTIHLGLFDSEENAARAYDEAAQKHHGDFARLNFPDTPYEWSPAQDIAMMNGLRKGG